AELAGGFGIGRAVTLPRRIEQSFGRQIDALPAATRLVLLVAAAEPVGQTSALLLKAAAQLEPLDARLARETYLEAFRAAWFTTDSSGGVTTRDVALAAASAPAPTTTPRPVDLLLDGLIVRYTEGYAAAAPVLRRALEAFDGAELAGEEALRWLWFASATALDLCDDAAADSLTGRFVQLSRETGALAALPMALSTRIALDVLAGDLDAAGMLIEELDAIADGTGIRTVPYSGQLFAAWKGRKGQALAVISASSAEAERRGEGLGAISTVLSRAVLFNGLGLFDDALAAAQQATASGQELGVLTWASLIELVTAASHSGRRDVACEAVRRLEVMTQASGTQWAAGMQSLCRAMVSADASAEKTYLQAVERLAGVRSRGQLARAHLYYGEWLRRKNRRSDARDQLRTSYDMFDAMGMAAFADTAARELAACGESVRKRGTGRLDQLTAQEEHIARLVAQGHSNAEIATRLFISPRTVEWHLSKIFTKLGITSRRQLRR
ncbi:MAG TPA: LuxR C-terminal-related transcriptional regulator, partial [Jatrophihabitantaceae bacterium]|nr:LuxR C-terminal-related transcriptional regulator [Jatrophihabitantaceae bacterium]